jgi:hypothetical protein
VGLHSGTGTVHVHVHVHWHYCWVSSGAVARAKWAPACFRGMHGKGRKPETVADFVSQSSKGYPLAMGRRNPPGIPLSKASPR